jgi:3',5'-cyclic-AMP phosphodiesterase
VLRWSAFAAVAAPAVARRELFGDLTRTPHQRDDVSPANLELVTLAEDHAVITWYTGYTDTDDGLGRMRPAPADGEVRYGTHPSRLRHSAGSWFKYTPYHYVELRGLEPGQTYYYEARSFGKRVPPTAFTLTRGNAVGTSDFGLATGGPYSFTTPMPPPGRHLFSIALCNDLHIGERTAGLVGGLPQIIGIEQVPGRPPYPEVMLESLVHDARAVGADYLLAAGDITAEALPLDLRTARGLLDHFGRYRRDYFVARGNHDRAHSGDGYDACRVGQWQGHDCFHDQFFPGDRPTYFTRDLHGLRVISIDTYDKPGNGGDAGGLSTEQLAWFRAELAKDAEQPTLVFGHHPLVVEQSIFPITPSSSLDATQAHTILQDYAHVPGLFLHHAGHTHRNKRTVSPVATAVTLQEVAAAKEYPGGFALLRLHSGGFALNFYKSRSRLAREWSERSRQEIFGLWPQFALGTTVADRNVVRARDLSNIRPARFPFLRPSRALPAELGSH